jgi:hypothetical protein
MVRKLLQLGEADKFHQNFAKILKKDPRSALALLYKSGKSVTKMLKKGVDVKFFTIFSCM